MKRIIKFRGKDCLTGVWVYGHYSTAKTRDPETGEKTIKHIIHADDGLHEVEEDTVGEYSGIHDCHQNEIFEKDIIKFTKGKVKVEGEWKDNYEVFEVEFHDAMLNICCLSMVTEHIEVIGNVYDNPELLKGGEE